LKSKYLSGMVLVLGFILSLPVYATVITLSNGDVLTVEQFRYEGDAAKFTTGTESRELPRGEIRDVSFMGEKRGTDELATDSADLAGYLEHAKQIMAKYPDSSSVLVLDEGEDRHKADGTNVNWYRGISYLAKEESLSAAEVAIWYDPNRERVKILHARSLSPDGTVANLSTDQIKVSKASSGDEFYNEYQQISFTIPNVNVGSLIDYAYETEEFNPFDKNLYQSHFFFQGNNPVGTSILRVKLPKGMPLYYVTPHCPPETAKPETKDEKDETVYTWTFKDMPPVIDEPLMPPARDVVPSVAFCLQKDWSYLFNRLKPMFQKRFNLSDAVKKKVDEITMGAKTLDEKIARLYLFCQKEIRYISIKGNIASGQTGHPAEETLKNRYGDCTDKGMLLATMLKHIGVEAYPVGILTNNSGKSIREIPIFDANHCITEVHLDGKIFYLDSTASDYRYPYFRWDDHETTADNTMLEKINPVPLPPPEDNAVKATRKMILSPDGTTRVEFVSEQNGSAESGFRASARGLKPEEYEKQVRASIAALTADYRLELATHSDPLDFSAPFQAKSTYVLNKFASRSGKYMIFEIPYFEMKFSEVSLDKRKYDISYPTTSLRVDDITVDVPPGFSVKYLPTPLQVKNPYIEFEVKYTHQGQTIKVFRKMAVLKRTVPVAEYQTYKEDLEKISKSGEERIFLEDTTWKGAGR